MTTPPTAEDLCYTALDEIEAHVATLTTTPEVLGELRCLTGLAVTLYQSDPHPTSPRDVLTLATAMLLQRLYTDAPNPLKDAHAAGDCTCEDEATAPARARALMKVVADDRVAALGLTPEQVAEVARVAGARGPNAAAALVARYSRDRVRPAAASPAPSTDSGAGTGTGAYL